MWLLLKEQIRNQTKTEERQVSGQVNSYVLAYVLGGAKGRQVGAFAFAVSCLFCSLVTREMGFESGERERELTSPEGLLWACCAKRFVCKALAPISSNNPLHG